MPLISQLKVGILLSIVFILNSCTILKPGLVNQEDLKCQAIEMKVDRGIGWASKKFYKFGHFFTSTFDRGMCEINNDEPNGWDLSIFQEEYTNAKQQFFFTQYDSFGNSLDVYCCAILNKKDVYYTESLKSSEVYRDEYNITLSSANMDQTLSFLWDSVASLKVGADTIYIISDCKYDVKAKIVFTGVLFKVRNLTIGAVDLTNRGIVWIRNDIDRKLALVIAAISTALLCKPKLRDMNYPETKPPNSPVN